MSLELHTAPHEPLRIWNLIVRSGVPQCRCPNLAKISTYTRLRPLSTIFELRWVTSGACCWGHLKKRGRLYVTDVEVSISIQCPLTWMSEIKPSS